MGKINREYLVEPSKANVVVSRGHRSPLDGAPNGSR